MISFKSFRFVLPVFAVVASHFLTTEVYALPVCGPGDHWVDNCSVAGGSAANPDFYTDKFDSLATVSIDILSDGNLDGSADITILLGGLVEIFRGDPVEGDSINDPGHLSHIDTELVSMTLNGSGVELRAGDGIANLQNDGALYSAGAIDEQQGNAALADSFFNVFVEIDILGIGTLHNVDPFYIASIIDRVPPLGLNYVHPFDALPVKLFDASGNLVAQIVQANHRPIPEPATCFLFAAGLGMLSLRKRNKTSGTIQS